MKFTTYYNIIFYVTIHLTFYKICLQWSVWPICDINNPIAAGSYEQEML